jgi:hypothetical protein
MVGQDSPQCVDGAGVLTGSLQLGKLVPHRTNELTSVGVLGQPVKSPGRQVQRRVAVSIGVVEAVGSLPR